MGLRDHINRKPGIALAVVVLLACLSIGLIVKRGIVRRSGGPTYAYFCDASTQGLFSADVREVGADSVRAIVFSCGQCEDDTTHFVGWLEKATGTGAAPAAVDGSAPVDSAALIAVFPGEGGSIAWRRRQSPEGAMILQQAMRRCDGSDSALTACVPSGAAAP